MVKTQNALDEQILKQETVSTLRAGIWQTGLGCLTPQRFYRVTKGYGIISLIVGRLLGTLVNSAFPERVDIDIPLNTVAVIGHGKLGLLKDVFYLETIDGKSYQLTPGYEAWLAAFKLALETHNKATLNQGEDQRWIVVH